MRQFIKPPTIQGKGGVMPRVPLRTAVHTRKAMAHPGLPNSPARLNAAERRQTAYELRLQGHAYQDIADAIGVSREAVGRYIRDAMRDVTAMTDMAAAELRAMRVEQLNRILSAHWDRRHEPKHAEICLKTLEKLNRVQGLEITQGNANQQPPAVQISIGQLDISLLTPQMIEWLEIIIKTAGKQLPAPADTIEGEVLSVDGRTE